MPKKGFRQADQRFRDLDHRFRKISISGRLAPESVVELKRNQWSASNGMGGRLAPECAPTSGDYSMKEIADHFGMHYSRVSDIIGAKGLARRKT